VQIVDIQRGEKDKKVVADRNWPGLADINLKTQRSLMLYCCDCPVPIELIELI
jgi:hypothetical protein